MKTALFTTSFFIILVLIGLVLLTGLATVALFSPQTSITLVEPESQTTSMAGPAITQESAAKVTEESTLNPALEFTLVTVAADGQLVFRGEGGNIDGLINPELHVRPGDTVRINLVNGDGMPHDLYVPDFNVRTDYVVGFGDQAEVVFTVGEWLPGPYVYYCTLPGHRSAGQEGLLVIEEQVR